VRSAVAELGPDTPLDTLGAAAESLAPTLVVATSVEANRVARAADALAELADRYVRRHRHRTVCARLERVSSRPGIWHPPERRTIPEPPPTHPTWSDPAALAIALEAFALGIGFLGVRTARPQPAYVVWLTCSTAPRRPASGARIHENERT
jgi:hypothetical protein